MATVRMIVEISGTRRPWAEYGAGQAWPAIGETFEPQDDTEAADLIHAGLAEAVEE